MSSLLQPHGPLDIENAAGTTLWTIDLQNNKKIITSLKFESFLKQLFIKKTMRLKKFEIF